jgi:hypothetical protein
MSETRESRPATRRIGYAVAVAVDVVLLVLINITPGWEAVPWLTSSFTQALPVLNLALTVGVLVNLVTLVVDPPWLVDAGQVLTALLAVAVCLRLLDVFPFDFSAYAVDWTLLARFVLWIGAFGAFVSIAVSLVRLARDLDHRAITH